MKKGRFSKHFSCFMLVIALVVSLTVPAFATYGGSPVTINLMAAASTRYSLGERVNGQYPTGTILRNFEDANSNITVNATYDSSGNLVNQMVADLKK